METAHVMGKTGSEELVRVHCYFRGLVVVSQDMPGELRAWCVVSSMQNLGARLSCSQRTLLDTFTSTQVWNDIGLDSRPGQTQIFLSGVRNSRVTGQQLNTWEEQCLQRSDTEPFRTDELRGCLATGTKGLLPKYLIHDRDACVTCEECRQLRRLM